MTATLITPATIERIVSVESTAHSSLFSPIIKLYIRLK